MSRYRDPQPQVGENYTDFFKIQEQTFKNLDFNNKIDSKEPYVIMDIIITTSILVVIGD